MYETLKIMGDLQYQLIQLVQDFFLIHADNEMLGPLKGQIPLTQQMHRRIWDTARLFQC